MMKKHCLNLNICPVTLMMTYKMRIQIVRITAGLANLEVFTLPHAFRVDSRGLLVLQRDSRGTPPGLQVHFGCVPGISKSTWSPGGVPLESRWSTRSPRESTWNAWGSVKTSNCLTSTVMILRSPILVVQYCSLENLFNPFELCDVCEHFK